MQKSSIRQFDTPMFSLEARIILGYTAYLYLIWYVVQELAVQEFNGWSIFLPGLPAIAFIWFCAHSIRNFPLILIILAGPIISMFSEVIHIEIESLAETERFTWETYDFEPIRYLRKTYIWSYFYLTWYFGYFVIIHYFRFIREGSLLARMRAEKSQTQFNIIRFKLNPHFLFNTLNSISTLVLEDKNMDAEKMIGNLSRFLRFSLDKMPSSMVSLEEELSVTQEYVEIEKLRFSDRLDMRYKIDHATLSHPVPNLIVQSITEALMTEIVMPAKQKHEIAISSDIADNIMTVRFTIAAEDANINNIQALNFKAIEDRLKNIYAHNASLKTTVTVSGLIITLSLPVIIQPAFSTDEPD